MKKLYTAFASIIRHILITTSIFTIASGFLISKTYAQSVEDEDGLYSDRPDLAQEQEIRITKDPATGFVPRERLLHVFDVVKQQRTQRKTIDPLSSATWVERGPKNVGGRTRAIMFDPNDVTNKKVWAGGVGGGLWYTNDITVASPTWTNVNDFWANLAISCIAYDPSNTQNFYIGTGEGYYNVDAIQGLGIWKTTDGGTTWSQLASTNNSTFYNVQKILVTSNGYVYAATRANGVMRSTDGGSTWAKVLGSGSGASFNDSGDLEIGADGTIFAAMGLYFHTDGVYSSATGNLGSWTKLNTGANGFPTSGFQRLEIGVAPSDANTLYVMAQDASTAGLYNIYKSANKGSTWTALGKPLWCDQGFSSTDMTRKQAWYDLILAVDPNDANIVLAGGVDVMKSTDGGTSWTQATQWTSGCGSMSIMHADQHAIVFQPGSSAIIVFGNDGGLYYSANGGTTIVNKNSGYNATQFYSCAIHPTAGQNYFLAGAQDNGSQKFTTVGINTTTAAWGGDGAFCFIDQTNSNYQIVSYVRNVYYRSTNGGSGFSSLVNDQSSGDFINPADYDDANGILYSSYCTPINNPTVFKIQRIANIRSTPSSPVQFSITGMTSMAGTIRVSPYAPGGTTTLFVGTQNGELYKVTNAQATPTTTSIGSASFPASGTISCVEIGASENDLLVTFSNYGVISVWRTTNGGTTWSNAEGNLPDMPVRWAIYNPNNLLEAFLATEVGVWSTTDVSVASPVWTANSSGLANVRTDMFQMRNSDKELIAATHGRGLFSSDVFFPAGSPPAADFTASPTTICAGSNVTFSDASTNTPTSWNWSFQGGNPATSVVQNPVITYSAAGTYSVSLIATNGSGSNTMNKTNFITVNAIPTASISVIPSATICNGAGVTLTASGGSTYSWSGGQTTTSITVSPTANTTYTVTGTNGNGCSSSAIKAITVNPIPTTSISVSPASTLCSGNSVTLTASGAATYNWSPGGQTTAVINVSPTTNTTYTVTGSNGCTSTATQTITVKLLPPTVISVSPSATICSGSSATLSVTGGVSYSWSTGQTTTSITVSPTANTTYTVIGTNAFGCTRTRTQLITIATPTITVTASPSATVCNGTLVTLTASGATSYSWAGGQTTASITNLVLSTSTYTVTGTSAIGCTNTTTTSVTVVAPPTVTVSVSPSSTICSGNSVTLSASGATTYNWSPGGQTTSVINVSPTINTTYTLTASNGCAITSTQLINVNPLPTPSISVTPSATICNGTNITLTASGGSTYSWAPGNQTTTSIAIAPTISTTYTLTATSASGCTNTSTKAITVNPIPVAPTAGNNSPICIGTTLSLTASTIAGVTYSWSGPNSFSSAAQNSTIAGATTAASGTYSVTATANGCTSPIATTSVTINALPTPSISVSPSATICSGNTITLTASGATMYNWSPGGQTTSVINVNPTTNTTYTLTGSNGCANTATQTITVNPLPTTSISVSPSTTICSGNGITLTAFGGVGYSWSSGETTTSITISPSTNTTYTVTGTNANGCSSAAIKTITVYAASTTSISVSPSSTICSGSSVTLTASGAATYNWSPGGQTTSVINVSPTTNTTYTVSGSNGCANASVQSIFVNPLPTISLSAGPSSTICSGNTVTLTASGGTTYLWTSGQTTTSILVAPIVSTTYTVIGTNANGCSKKATQLITISIPTFSISASPSTNVCSGNGVTLTASGGSTYTWSPGGQTTANIVIYPTANATYTLTGTNAFGCSKNITKSITISSPNVSVSVSPSATICTGGIVTLTASGASVYNWSPGGQTTPSVIDTVISTTTYTVIGTNGNGCTNSSTKTLTVNPTPIITITTNPSTTICSGSITTLAAAGATTYSWSPGGKTTSVITVSPTTSTNYTVTGSNGCATTTTQMITVNPLPSVTISVSPSSTICAGSHDTLTASGASNYLWASGQTTSSIAVSPTTNTTYIVTGTNANGCSNQITKTITISIPTVSISVSPSSVICSGNSITLSASGTAAYSWLPGGQTSASIVVNPTANTSYTVAGTNTIGCSNTATKAVTISSPIVHLNVTPSTTICIGASVSLSTSGASTYSWSSGQTATSIVVSPSTSTTYSVTGTNGLGCTSTIAKTITVDTFPIVTINTFPSSPICSGNSMTLVASGATTYQWLPNGQTTSALHVYPTANSTYTVTGSNGCTSTATQTVTVNALPVPTLTFNPDTVCKNAPSFLLSGGVPTGGIYLGPGVSAGMFNPAAAGAGIHIITYSFTDSLGCTGNTTAKIYVSLCTDVQSIPNNQYVTIFPNPSSGIFQVTISGNSPYSLDIYNILGENVYAIGNENASNINHQPVNIDLSFQPSGVYFLHIKTDKGSFSQKLILQK